MAPSLQMLPLLFRLQNDVTVCVQGLPQKTARKECERKGQEDNVAGGQDTQNRIFIMTLYTLYVSTNSCASKKPSCLTEKHERKKKIRDTLGQPDMSTQIGERRGGLDQYAMQHICDLHCYNHFIVEYSSSRICRFRAAMALCASGYLTQHGKITSLKISKQAVPAWISTQPWSLYTRELTWTNCHGQQSVAARYNAHSIQHLCKV